MQSCHSQSDLVNIDISQKIENDETDSFSDGGDIGCLSAASTGSNILGKIYIIDKLGQMLRLNYKAIYLY